MENVNQNELKTSASRNYVKSSIVQVKFKFYRMFFKVI